MLPLGNVNVDRQQKEDMDKEGDSIEVVRCRKYIFQRKAFDQVADVEDLSEDNVDDEEDDGQEHEGVPALEHPYHFV